MGTLRQNGYGSKLGDTGLVIKLSGSAPRKVGDASPSGGLALSPLVTTFLDGIDVSSFRAQILPRLQRMEQMEAVESGQLPPVAMPTMEEAPNGW